MRTSYIAGNWKMHKTVAEAQDLANKLKDDLAGSPHRLMVAPPFTALAAVADVLRGSNILVGAQNMGPELSGAHTGEVSAAMLRDVGAQVVILGHSERRHTYGESDELINRKVNLALTEGLEVILCVGETLDEREAGRVETVVRTHIEKGLAGVERGALSGVTIAYEPVWAIGTGKTATPEDAEAVHAFARTVLAEMYDSDAAEAMVIQYGGSVKPNNVKGLMAQPSIDGALVGGASLQPDTFVPIAQFER